MAPRDQSAIITASFSFLEFPEGQIREAFEEVLEAIGAKLFGTFGGEMTAGPGLFSIRECFG